jgi:hypothetical protein
MLLHVILISCNTYRKIAVCSIRCSARTAVLHWINLQCSEQRVEPLEREGTQLL